MTTIKTTIHTYDFDTRDPEQKRAYDALRESLKGWPHCMTAFGNYLAAARALAGGVVELETKHLFDNQWNTPTARVFDWAQTPSTGGPVSGKNAPSWAKRGYYLEQTAEMRELRRNTHKCGYCGKQEPAAKGYVFCPHCIDSEYLTEKDLPLTRMRSVENSGVLGTFAPLTEAERAHLLPLFRDAQLHGTTERGKARIAKQRADIAADLVRTNKHAQAKHDGLIWLLDHSVNIDNVIYYDTGRFGFGWRKPVDAAIVSQLLGIISEFGHPYDIKCADGRTLSGN